MPKFGSMSRRARQRVAEMVTMMRVQQLALPDWHPGKSIVIPDTFHRSDKMFEVLNKPNLVMVLRDNPDARARKEYTKRKRKLANKPETAANKKENRGGILRARQVVNQSPRKRKAIARAAAKARWRKRQK